MNNLRLLFLLATVTALLQTGCASKPNSRQEHAAVAASAPLPAPLPGAVAPPTNEPPSEPIDVIPPDALAKPPAPFHGGGWGAIFNGENLTGWRVVDFAGRGEVECRAGVIRLHMGQPFTGISYTNEFPRMNYEVAFDAMRFMGSDFFCGMTVPVNETYCSLIVGGWGGGLVGVSSLDGMDASENETTKYMSFERGRWYRIRMRVTQNRLEAWIDDEKKVDVVTKDRKISMRPGDIELLVPFGIASWQTGSALREIRMCRVEGPADPAKPF